MVLFSKERNLLGTNTEEAGRIWHQQTIWEGFRFYTEQREFVCEVTVLCRAMQIVPGGQEYVLEQLTAGMESMNASECWQKYT